MNTKFKPAQAFSDKPYVHIPLVPVESNQVAGIGYDAARQTLAVHFNYGKGSVYHYPNVEQKTHADFMAAESKGGFFASNIKHLPFEKFGPHAVEVVATRETLLANVKAADDVLQAAKAALEEFDQAPEQHVFDSIEAAWVLEDTLRGRASEDCEGSYNCGDEFYEQEFIVDGVHHIARLDVEYNRHDKTYYYIDSSEFTTRLK